MGLDGQLLYGRRWGRGCNEMMNFLKTAFIVALLCLTSTSFAEQAMPPVERDPAFQFQFLFEQCGASADLCVGYVSGVGQMMALIGFVEKSNPSVSELYGICPSGGVSPSGNAMIQAVINFGRNHPEKWSYTTIFPTAMALSQTWPCR
jgi:hypothetical protein